MNKILSILCLLLVACNPSFPMPEGIHPGQMVGTGVIEGQSYALVAKRNMNTSLFEVPLEYETSFSGVLVERDGEWNRFAEIISKSAINNPLNLWNEDGQWYLSVMDSSGAGSGEGHAKLFRKKNAEDSSWELLHCWYHVSEEDRVTSLQEVRVQQAGDQILRNSLGRFEQVVVEREGSQRVIPLPECGNAEVRTITVP